MATGLGMKMQDKLLSGCQEAVNTGSSLQQWSRCSLQPGLRAEEREHPSGRGGGELPGGLIKEHDRWVVDQFQGDGQALPLASGEQGCPRVGAGHQAQCCQDLCHLAQPTPPTLDQLQSLCFPGHHPNLNKHLP